ncbi:MAG: hypothetical protein ABW184_16445 [Sphingobium sp.]
MMAFCPPCAADTDKGNVRYAALSTTPSVAAGRFEPGTANPIRQATRLRPNQAITIITLANPRKVKAGSGETAAFKLNPRAAKADIESHRYSPAEAPIMTATTPINQFNLNSSGTMRGDMVVGLNTLRGTVKMRF